MDASKELVIEDAEDKENLSNSNMSRTSFSTSIPVTPVKEATKASRCPSSSITAAKASKVLGNFFRVYSRLYYR